MDLTGVSDVGFLRRTFAILFIVDILFLCVNNCGCRFARVGVGVCINTVAMI